MQPRARLLVFTIVSIFAFLVLHRLSESVANGPAEIPGQGIMSTGKTIAQGFGALDWKVSPPKSYSVSEDKQTLTVNTDDKLDYWRHTYYNPPIVKDDGHLMGLAVPHDKFVTLEVHFKLEPAEQFDQAGLMIRSDKDHWLKTGIEVVDGHPKLSCVVTNGFSDWSTQPWTANELHIRMHKLADSVVVEAKDDKGAWNFIRIAHLGHSADAATADVGIFTCSPTKGGMRVTFKDFSIVESEGYHHKA